MILKAMLVVDCMSEFTCEAPDGWDDMDDKQKKDYFLGNSESIGGLCHQCSNHTQTDHEVRDDWTDKYFDVEDIRED